ncbi:MAG TPA: hypothetical protein VL463_18310 [Kofleriaceae bacterium]|nr:hypothetical protein [Kofleriaceae bacterium]
MSSRIWIATLIALGACMKPITRRTGEFKPRTPGYAYHDGTVVHDGQPEYQVVETDVDATQTYYEVKGAGGGVEAAVTLMSSYGGLLLVRADFPSLGKNYEARMPIAPFTNLLASYIDQGVLTNGRLDPNGLQAYADANGLRLVDTAAQIHRLDEAADRATCGQCMQDYRRCEIDQSADRAHPQPGMHVVQSCEAQFQTCSQGGVKTTDAWPCGQPSQ